jgi:sugar phosphate isomerase/epimerase
MFRCMSAGAINVKGTLQEKLNYAKKAGFQGMDCVMGEALKLAAEMGSEGIKAHYREAGLRPGVMGFGQNWRGTEAEHEQFVKDLPKLAKIAAEIGVTGFSTYVIPTFNTPLLETIRFAAKRLRPIAQIIKDHGLRFGLENVGPRTSREGKEAKDKYTFISSVSGMIALGELIGTGNMGVLLDSFHWFTSLGTVEDILSMTADDVVHVHINDAPARPIEEQEDLVRALPGETGVIDMTGFLGALKKIGYKGAVTPEPFSDKLKTMSSEEAAMTAGKTVKQVWDAAGISAARVVYSM